MIFKKKVDFGRILDLALAYCKLDDITRYI